MPDLLLWKRSDFSSDEKELPPMRTVFMNCSMVYSLTGSAFFFCANAGETATIRVKMSRERRLFRFMERYSFLQRWRRRYPCNLWLEYDVNTHVSKSISRI